MTTPFDIINNLSASKNSIWDDIEEKDYNSFMINRGMSYYPDCIMHANEMNIRYSIDKKNQYDYYLYAIEPKKKRFSKWSTSKKDKEIQQISEYFNVSLTKAIGIRSLISVDEMAQIVEKLDRGGT